MNGRFGVPSSPTWLRIGDAERESAVAALGEHFAAGRISHEEFDQRSAAAWEARTTAELAPLFGDLPHPHPAAPGGYSAPVAPRRRSRGPRFPWLPAAALSLVVAILTPVPFLVVLLVAWLCFTSCVRPGVTRWHHTGPAHTSGRRRDVRGTWA